MANTGQLRRGAGHGAADRSSTRAVERPCSRPSCTTQAAATLTFRYGTREAWIERLADHDAPQAYDLCVTHAARTHPPEGWQLRDRRPEDERRPVQPLTTPVDLGGDRTVAVLAAALRSVPDPVSEDAIADPTEVDRAVASLEPHPQPSEPALALDLAEPAGVAPAAAAPTVAPEREAPSPRPPLVVRERAAGRELAADW